MKKALGPVTLAYPMPAFLVAAYDEEGKANIMTAAWGGIFPRGRHERRKCYGNPESL